PSDEAAEGDEPHDRDDDPEQQAPGQCDDDPDDDQHAAEADPANASASVPTERHLRSFRSPAELSTVTEDRWPDKPPRRAYWSRPSGYPRFRGGASACADLEERGG